MLNLFISGFYLLLHIVWGRWLLITVSGCILFKQGKKMFMTDKIPQDQKNSYLEDVSLIAFVNWSVLAAVWLCYMLDLLGYKDFSQIIE